MAWEMRGGKLQVSGDEVRDMLGLVDKTSVFNALSALFAGDISEALKILNNQYVNGSDVVSFLQDIMSLIHNVTRLKINPQDDLGLEYSAKEKEDAKELAEKLTIGSLSRAWQVMLKGMEEIKFAPDSLMAAEMLFIRFSHLLDMPSPEDLLKKLKSENGDNIRAGAVQPIAKNMANAGAVSAVATATAQAISPAVASEVVAAAKPSHLTLASNKMLEEIECFEDIAKLLRRKNEAILRHSLEEDVALVEFEIGRIVLKKHDDLPNDFAKKLATILHGETGQNWQIIFDNNGSAKATIRQQNESTRLSEIEEVKKHELVAEIMSNFAGAEIKKVRHIK